MSTNKKEYLKKYREENKEILAQKRHEKYKRIRKDEKNIEEMREYHRNYYYKNKNKYKKYNKKNWQKIKHDPILYQKNKNQVNKWRSTPSGIYTSLKNRGRHDFSLTKEEFIDWYNKQQQKCDYCNLSLEQIRKLPAPFNRKNGLIKFSIDRKDNNMGYVLDNITLSCFTCNTIKNNFLTYEEMKKIGKEILYPKLKKLI